MAERRVARKPRVRATREAVDAAIAAVKAGGTVSAVAELHGVAACTLSALVRDAGVSPRRSQGERFMDTLAEVADVFASGTAGRTVKAVCEAKGYPYSAFTKRLSRLGMSLSDIVGAGRGRVMRMARGEGE